MEEKVLTISELAGRWKCSEQALYKFREQGILKHNPNIPGIKFPISYIESLELYGIDPLSPFERRRLEEEISGLKKEVEMYKTKLRQISELTEARI